MPGGGAGDVVALDPYVQLAANVCDGNRLPRDEAREMVFLTHDRNPCLFALVLAEPPRLFSQRATSSFVSAFSGSAPDVAWLNVIGDISPVFGFGGVVGTCQVVDLVTTPASHGVAVVGESFDAPDIDGLGRTTRLTNCWKSTASR